MSAVRDTDLFGNHTFVSQTCGGCGITFGMLPSYQEARKNDHKIWYCPNGCQRYFVGETEADQLKKQLAIEKENTEFYKKRRDELEKKNRATRAWLTRTQNEKERLVKRIQNGVCPCCKRSFQNLKRHMETKHKDKNQ